MNLKKYLKSTDLGITVLIIAGILVVLNFFSYQIFYRWDLTQNKDYSISKVSKRAVGELEDIVNIKVYFSNDLPNQLITLKQEVGDILDEYQNYSNGNIRVEFINPEEIGEQELLAKGIPALQFNVLEKDKYQVVKGYLGIIVEYGGKKEVLPIVQNTDNFEYQVTLAIKKVTSEDTITIGYIVSNGASDLENELSIANKKLQELYEVRPIDLSTAKEVAQDINTLLIVGPKEEFSEEQLKMIDSFLMRGGSLLLMVDGVKVEEGLFASSNDLNLDNLLEAYGVKLNHDLVLDTSSGMASFYSGFITFSINYPLWPKIIKQGFDQDNAIVSKLESITLPWSSSVDILTDKQDESNRISYLAKTTNRAWRQTESYDLNPQQQFIPANDSKQYSLAISVAGTFNSAFGQERTDSGKLIIVGDSDFISDNFLQQPGDNLVFFQNLVDSLSLDEDLINIRSKGVSDRPIKEITDGQKTLARYFNVFGLTLIVIIFGMIRYFIRRRRRFVDEI
ncbi:MAG: GldG family protein [Patescibacteria group bacterium]